MNNFIEINGFLGCEIILFKDNNHPHKKWTVNIRYIQGFSPIADRKTHSKKHRNWKEEDFREDWPESEIWIVGIGCLYVLESNDEIMEMIKEKNYGKIQDY